MIGYYVHHQGRGHCSRATAVAGLGHPYCEGVLALTDDDEANLAVAQTASLLRPDLPVITRTVSPTMAARTSSGVSSTA